MQMRCKFDFELNLNRISSAKYRRKLMKFPNETFTDRISAFEWTWYANEMQIRLEILIKMEFYQPNIVVSWSN